MQSNHPASVIEIKNLSFMYDKETVLEDINLTVHEKDFFVLIGPNGGGKSTLMKLILGLLPLQKGSIKLFGKPLQKKLSHIGYVPQNTNINVHFPIKAIEVVMMGCKPSQKDPKAEAMHYLKQVGMENFAMQKIGSLSGGQRQRVMIARALCAHPKVLLLDEPTSSIDAKGQAKIYELIQELNQKMTVIVISHDISILLKYATKVAHINKNLAYHELGSYNKVWDTKKDHICEVELLEMLGSCRC